MSVKYLLCHNVPDHHIKLVNPLSKRFVGEDSSIAYDDAGLTVHPLTQKSTALWCGITVLQSNTPLAWHRQTNAIQRAFPVYIQANNSYSVTFRHVMPTGLLVASLTSVLLKTWGKSLRHSDQGVELPGATVSSSRPSKQRLSKVYCTTANFVGFKQTITFIES